MRERTDTGYSPKDKWVLTLVVLLYMVYPTLLTSVFSILACRYVGGQAYLDADMHITRCLTRELSGACCVHVRVSD